MQCVDCGNDFPSAVPETIVPAITLKPAPEEPAWFGIDRRGWLALAAGALAAATAVTTVWLSFIFGFLTTIVHEIGHSAAGWFFGYPSVPTFDFTYGGGVTLQQERIIWLVLLVVLVFAWYMFSYRRNRASLVLLGAALGLYLLMALTPAHQGVVLALGHGAELLFAGYLLYRVMGGSRVRHEFARPVYAFLGLFILMDNIRFSYLLAFDEAQRRQYETVSAIGFQMDFSRLAQHYLSTSVSSVAVLFLVLCLLTPVFSYACLRKREALAVTVRSLRERNPRRSRR